MNRHNCMEAFEKLFALYRLDREPREDWVHGAIYQDGKVNNLYAAFELGCKEKQSADPWLTIMGLAEGAGFIVSAAGGTAVLATHGAQKSAGIYEKTQRMNGREEQDGQREG